MPRSDALCLALSMACAPEPIQEMDGCDEVLCIRREGETECRMIDAGSEPEVLAAPAVELSSMTCTSTTMCGLDQGGRAHCWGQDSGGREALLQVPEEEFTWLDGKANVACGIRKVDSQIQCWGSEIVLGYLGPLPEGPFERVYVVGYGVCGAR